jgi:excinuclease ABC subunit C
VLYVGKAKNLRSRLTSYFAAPYTLHPRTAAMVSTASKVDWTVVPTEVAALQLEYSWIKEFQPRFNVRYRDDKSYPYLAITMNEEYPRAMVMRGRKRRGVRYYGPYSHAWAIRETLDQLLRVFPVRTCSKGVFDRARQSDRPCLLGYIGKCAAPCVGRVDAAEHRRIAADLVSFLDGRTGALVERLQTEMAQASEVQDYERAARLRDDLAAVRRVLERNPVVLSDGTNADVVAVADDGLEVAAGVFHVREGRVRGRRGWIADMTDEPDPAALVGRLLLQLYGEAESQSIPPLLLVPVQPDDDALADFLADRRGGPVSIRVPVRGARRDLLGTVLENAEQTLAQHKARRASDLTTRSVAMEEIQQALGLQEPPLRIECFDVSNLHGNDVVGSMVVFEDGLPRKGEYRRFSVKARGQGGASDVAAVHEVVHRRFTRYLAERDGDTGSVDHDAAAGPVPPDTDEGASRSHRFAYPPSLVVIDGGAPQVAAATAALTELGLVAEVAVCGLAKRLEEVWLPGAVDPVIMSRRSEGLYLLQRVRDEAHRFAVTYHRSRRSRSMLASLLDEVPGLGEVRRRALLEHFGSLARLRRADAEQIAAVPGIGAKTAAAVIDALSTDAPASEPPADAEGGAPPPRQ